jgi:hypothetical protein
MRYVKPLHTPNKNKGTVVGILLVNTKNSTQKDIRRVSRKTCKWLGHFSKLTAACSKEVLVVSGQKAAHIGRVQTKVRCIQAEALADIGSVRQLAANVHLGKTKGMRISSKTSGCSR